MVILKASQNGTNCSLGFYPFLFARTCFLNNIQVISTREELTVKWLKISRTDHVNSFLSTIPRLWLEITVLFLLEHIENKRLSCIYQCPICLGSIVQQNNSQLAIALPSLINKFNRLKISICPVLVYPLCVERSVHGAFKWISVSLNAPFMYYSY